MKIKNTTDSTVVAIKLINKIVMLEPGKEVNIEAATLRSPILPSGATIIPNKNDVDGADVRETALPEINKAAVTDELIVNKLVAPAPLNPPTEPVAVVDEPVVDAQSEPEGVQIIEPNKNDEILVQIADINTQIETFEALLIQTKAESGKTKIANKIKALNNKKASLEAQVKPE
jgi:hypothetical protein